MASVIVRKSDNIVIAASDDDALKYDPAVFDNLHPATNPVPANTEAAKYMRDAGGNIVKRPEAELILYFDDERNSVIKAHLAVIQADTALLQATKDAIAGIISALA